MTKQERAEMYRDFLSDEGYRPYLDDDGDVVFKKENRTYIIVIDEKDEEFFRLVFPNFWPIESEDEREKVIKASCEATARTKVAKIFPVRDNVWGTIEMFCWPPESAKAVINRSMSALMAAVDTFAQSMRGDR